MKSKKKVVLTLLCAALLVFASVMGTMAYLTKTTEVATNTFTAGNVDLTLDETDVNIYGEKDSDTRVTENDYKMIPGHTYVKDPTIHITVGSEECWLFVEVTDEIAAIQDDVTVAAQMTANGWTKLEGVDNVYAYKSIVDARDNKVDIPVFANFKIKTDAKVADYEGKTIKVQGYAVQADGFATAAAAWEAAFK